MSNTATMLESEAKVLSKKEEKELRTRQRIVAGALNEFKKFGFSKVSMDEIATALAMSKKTIYKHFSTKEDLLMASVQFMQQCVHDEVNPIFEEKIDFINKMMKIGSKVSEKMTEMPLNFLYDIQKNAPEVWQQHQEFKQYHIRKSFTDFLEMGIKDGKFRADMPKELLIKIYYGLISHLFQPSQLINSKMDVSSTYFAMMRLLFEGMLSANGRNEYFDRAQESAKTYNKDQYFLRTNE